jgi:HEAT repeat protein
VVDRRRRVALAGHRGDEAEARSGLADASSSVRATALGALDRLGALTDDDLRHAVLDPDAPVRRRGAELAATRPGVSIVGLLNDRDPSVVEMAAWSLGEREERTAVGSLSALASGASGHRDPLCREAAVAALGAIGDQAGLPAVLSALDDKPAVRRRAAVALAAFEGPPVEAALRRCLTDRDWQVRQVAEDLLAVE